MGNPVEGGTLRRKVNVHKVSTAEILTPYLKQMRYTVHIVHTQIYAHY